MSGVEVSGTEESRRIGWAGPDGPSRRWRRAVSGAAVVVLGFGGSAAAQGVAGAAESARQGPPKVIVGGTATTTADYPWMVALSSRQTFGSARSGQFCGGALIAPDRVLTAAHCVVDENGSLADYPDFRVIQGRTNLGGTQGREVVVSAAHPNPSFDTATVAGDWAVLELAEELPGPVLPTVGQSENVYAADTPATVLGWGDTTGYGDYSSVLRKVTVPVTTDATCRSAYPGGVLGTYDAASMVCAGLPQGGKDACSADSGGPMLIGGRLAGIVSWGSGCALPRKPGVYTRVSAFADDIQAAASSATAGSTASAGSGTTAGSGAAASGK